MNTPQVYIAIAIVALAIIALLVFVPKREKKSRPLSPLATLSMFLFVAGLLFNDNRFVGYGFFGAAVVVAVIDMINKCRTK